VLLKQQATMISLNTYCFILKFVCCFSFFVINNEEDAFYKNLFVLFTKT